MRIRLIKSCALVIALAGCAIPQGERATGVNLNTATGSEAERVSSRSIPRPARVQGNFIRVDKSERTLTVYRGQQVLRVFGGLQFGDVPNGHKQFQGDERTPEGRYTIDLRNPQSSYFLSLRISYPNANDRAFARQWGRSPGGDIYIHGQPNGMNYGRMRGDWTDGCIALSNAEIRELWSLVPDGTTIVIQR